MQALGSVGFQLAERDPGQFQQGLAAPVGGNLIGFGDGENQPLQLFYKFGRALLHGRKPGGQCGHAAHRVDSKTGRQIGLHGVGRYDGTLFQQRFQCFPAQFIPDTAGQKARYAGNRNTGTEKRCAAGFAQCPFNSGSLVLLGGLRRFRAVDDSFVPVLVGHGQLDALGVKVHGKMYRNALQFPAEQFPGFGRGGPGGGSISLGAHAEHGAVVAPGQVAIRKTGTGENIPHQPFVIGLPLPHGTAGGHTGGSILRRAQAAFDLDAGHAGLHQFPQVGNMVHVFQAQVAGLARFTRGQAGRGVKGQTAGTGTGTAVAAASAQESAHHALTADTHTEGTVDEYLALDGTGGADGPDLFQRELPRQNDPVVPQGRQLFGTGGSVHAHLGGTVQM